MTDDVDHMNPSNLPRCMTRSISPYFHISSVFNGDYSDRISQQGLVMRDIE